MAYSLTEPEKEQAKQLLLKVLSIPTVNSRDNEGELAAFLARYFRDAGIPAEVQHIDGKHGNVIARIGGEPPGPHRCFQRASGYGSLRGFSGMGHGPGRAGAARRMRFCKRRERYEKRTGRHGFRACRAREKG